MPILPDDLQRRTTETRHGKEPLRIRVSIWDSGSLMDFLMFTATLAASLLHRTPWLTVWLSLVALFLIVHRRTELPEKAKKGDGEG